LGRPLLARLFNKKGENIMEHYWSNIIILYEDGLWVGYFETANHNGEGYRAARHVFGPEPSDAQLREFFLQNGTVRLHWTTAAIFHVPALCQNPKRRTREAAKAVRNSDGSSRAREAVKAGLAQRKAARRHHRKRVREQERQTRFALHQQKRKNKHRGH
jgi:hypothetical protein